jgi:hypothetical protein
MEFMIINEQVEEKISEYIIMEKSQKETTGELLN